MLHEVGRVKQNLNCENTKQMKWQQTGKNDQSLK